MKQNGIFTISLDFELFWGVRDKKTIESYKENLENTENAINEMLELFDKKSIHVTWATVGFLFASSSDDLKQYLPKLKPQYNDINLSPYKYIESYDDDDSYHFAEMIIKKIQSFSNQEIGTHTFSHYYCLSEGSDINSFKYDLSSAIQISSKNNIFPKSLVFPRNQFNNSYLSVIKEHGITSYRGNPTNWIYKESRDKESIFKRIIRLIDHYVNISGHNTFDIFDINSKMPYNIPASRFLRPYNSKLQLFEKYRLKRIKDSMTYAAKNNELFHLWWHPHNFGMNTKKNIISLENLLNHFIYLNKKYNMKSYNMNEISLIIKQEL